MRYLYYPGCSLEGSAIEYNASTQAVMEAMGIDVVELQDWTCCGASAAEAVSYLLTIALSARNLALSGKEDDGADLLIPCSACYLNLRRVEEHIKEDEGLLGKINEVLKEDALTYDGKPRARHLLDVIANDVGPEMVQANVKRKLSGIRVAPYYGCQCLRPYGSYDDPEQPKSLESIIEALGGEVHPWTMGAKCCGAGLMTTEKDVALDLVGALLTAAKGADCIVTVCPMCQMNLDTQQRKVSRNQGEDLSISVLYLPQLMGLAFGLTEERLHLNRNMVFLDAMRSKVARI
jgi:heterodisulfide reductase subunit B